MPKHSNSSRVPAVRGWVNLSTSLRSSALFPTASVTGGVLHCKRDVTTKTQRHKGLAARWRVMIKGKRVVVVMPAYNAEDTIEKTWREVLDQEIVDLVIIVDDASQDRTAELARRLDRVVLHLHARNSGYGANQKTCYRLALENGADIVIMVHPDYQYTPKLIPAMAGMVASGLYSCVLASRILGGQALQGGMPMWRYVANRGLTLVG